MQRLKKKKLYRKKIRNKAFCAKQRGKGRKSMDVKTKLYQ